MSPRHKLPFDSIKIMGMEYKVILVPGLTEDGEDCWGTTDTNAYEIRLADGPRKRVNRTLCHELVHAWQDALGIEPSEEQAIKFEVTLFDLFSNQPKVVAFLQDTKW
jgi:hypothetical protein